MAGKANPCGKFKDLSVGTMFEFDRTGFEHSGMVTGPWVKLSTRQYTAHDTDNALYGHKITVGSVNVKVVKPFIEKNFFGPQKYVAEIITHPPYTTRVNMTRYGYESEHVIYDVVIPEKPIHGITRWYKTNGISSPFPTATHRRIEIHFNIGIPTYTGQ